MQSEESLWKTYLATHIGSQGVLALNCVLIKVFCRIIPLYLMCYLILS
jgi:hypothetical protein